MTIPLPWVKRSASLGILALAVSNYELNAQGRADIYTAAVLPGIPATVPIDETRHVGIAIDRDRTVYVSAPQVSRVFSIDAAGRLVPAAGNGLEGCPIDGSPAIAAPFKRPSGLAFDAAGNLLIADRDCNAVYRVRATDRAVFRIAGSHADGFSGDGEPAALARLYDPTDVAVDSKGNIYIADAGNHRIRRVGPDGIITTFAGDGNVDPNFVPAGQAASISLKRPTGIEVDESNMLWIADSGFEVIRRVEIATRSLATPIGSRQQGAECAYSGPAATICLAGPSDIALGFDGTILIADTYNNFLLRYDRRDSMVTVLAGNGSPAFAGDGGAAIDASLRNPSSVAVDPDGQIYIGDAGNQRVRGLARSNSQKSESAEQCPLGTALNIGYSQGVRCNITQAKKFTFRGLKGDRVVAQAVAISGTRPCLQVTRPEGSIVGQICRDRADERRVDVPLPVDGEYAIHVSGSGDYTILVDKVAPAPAEAAPASNGLVASIDFLGDSDLFYFAPRAATQYEIRIASIYGGQACIEVFSAEGLLESQCGGPDPVIHFSSGSHTGITFRIRENEDIFGPQGLHYGLYLCQQSCESIQEPPPTITGLTPSSAPRGSTTLTAVIRGEYFSVGSVVLWNGNALQATFFSSSEIQATIAETLLASEGEAQIQIRASDGRHSNSAPFKITRPDPQPLLSKTAVLPAALSFPSASSIPSNGSQDDLVRIMNGSAEPMRYMARIEGDAEWLSLIDTRAVAVTRVEGALPPSGEVQIRVRVELNRLRDSQRDGVISVQYGPQFEFSTKVNVFAVAPVRPHIQLSREALHLIVSASDLVAGSVKSEEFYVLNLGEAPLRWLATPTETAWLSLAPNQNTEPLPSVFSSLTSNRVQVNVNLRDLRQFLLPAVQKPEDITAERSFARDIVVRAEGYPELSKTLPVTVTVLPDRERLEVILKPTGFLFVGDEGVPLQPQTLQVQSNTGRTLGFSAAPTGRWKSFFNFECVERCSYQLSSKEIRPFPIEPNLVTPSDPAELYAARLPIAFDEPGAGIRGPNGIWNIEGLVIRRPGASLRAACASSQLHLISTSLSHGFLVSRTSPETIELKIADNCGHLVEQGSVIALPSNGDAAIRLRPAGGGIWQGTWQPARSGAALAEDVVLNIEASNLLGAQGQLNIKGTIRPTATPNPTIPVVLNAASFQHSNVIVPGEIVSLFGTDLLSVEGVFTVSALPAPLSVFGTSVWLGEQRVPILSAVRSQGVAVPVDQINVVIPFSIAAGQPTTLRVEREGRFSVPAELQVAEARPGLFRGAQFAAALDQRSQLVTAANRVERGQIVQLFATGLGRVTDPPKGGNGADAAPLSYVVNEVRVLFNGIPQRPDFAGLTPGLLGVYQLNVRVPPIIATPDDIVEIAVEIDGIASDPVALPLR